MQPHETDDHFEPLVAAAAERYRRAGRYALHFAKGKLGLDPMFRFFLKEGLLPGSGQLYDLGCGQGVLLSLLKVARERFTRGEWPADWPAPPCDLRAHGVELRPGRARAARLALDDATAVTLGDVRSFELPRCSAIAILDVLLYLERDEQGALLQRCASALDAGGVLLLREADAAAGRAFRFTVWAERVACWTRGQFRQKLTFRPAAEWKALLDGLGFAVNLQPMSMGTPFGNMLYVARRAA